MQTRRLRLGDVVDDYCPRERRLSNHVIVAMVDHTIKQTRCSTCDFEHPYKEAKVPPRRKKKDAPSALFQQVLENVTEQGPSPAAVSASTPASTGPAAPVMKVAAVARGGAIARGGLRSNGQAARETDMDDAASTGGARQEPAARHESAVARREPVARHEPGAAAASPLAAASATDAHVSAEADQDQPVAHEEEAPLHRRALIRATLPRPVGEVPVRQAPSFTIREAAAARPNKFRYKARPPGGGARQGRPQGMGVSGNQARPGGGRGPQARGAGKKAGAHPSHQPHRSGGHQSARGPKGPHGNKRFK